MSKAAWSWLIGAVCVSVVPKAAMAENKRICVDVVLERPAGPPKISKPAPPVGPTVEAAAGADVAKASGEAPKQVPEPTGVVVAGSEGGGLKDAIGPCGVTFPNNSATGLRDALRGLLTEPGRLESFRAGAAAHLARFRRAAAARSYLEVMEKALGEGGHGTG